MAQDDRKGQSPPVPPESAGTSEGETPGARDMKAPPPPETPDTHPDPKPDEANPGASRGAGEDGGKDADGGSGDEDSGGANDESETDRLRREVGEAEAALAAKKAELAGAEERRKAEEATTQMVADYSKEVAGLTASEDGLEQYRVAEISYLGKFLDEARMKVIETASAEPQAEIDKLAARIEADAASTAGKKDELDAAKAKAGAAKAKADALKRPAAMIRDRLKAAEAIRSDAKAAIEVGNYALAYWLIMKDGRMHERLGAEPRIIEAKKLEAELRQSAADLEGAEQDVAAREGELKSLEAALETDRARLAALKAGLEAKVRERLAELNPKPATAA